MRFTVTGTDTDVGKTVFSAALTGHLRALYWKPVQAGLEGGSDRETVSRLSGLGPDCTLPEAYRLNTPCSPHQAAAIDGVEIGMARLALPPVAGPLVVEGAGGVMVPIAPGKFMVDLFVLWGLPVVLAARTSLGTINHTLLSLEALRARGLTVHGVAFIGEENVETERVICAEGGVQRLGRLGRVDPLDAANLAQAFATGFDTEAFA